MPADVARIIISKGKLEKRNKYSYKKNIFVQFKTTKRC